MTLNLKSLPKSVQDRNSKLFVSDCVRSQTFPIMPKPQAIGLQFIKEVLEINQVFYETEYRFDKKRMFRFDIAIPHLRLGIEYEGLVATGKKGGHQTKRGYTNNCDKYNIALISGWKVLRYTCLNYKQFESDLMDLLKQRK